MIPVKLLMVVIGIGIVILIMIIALIIVLMITSNKKKEIPHHYGESPLTNGINVEYVANPREIRKDALHQEDNEHTVKPAYVDDIRHYKIPTSDKSTIHIGKIHAVGRRKNQQDSFAYSEVQNMDQIEKKGVLLLVADGMGGLFNGAEISSIVANEMLRYFDENDISEDVSEGLRNMLAYTNEKVNEFLGPQGIGQGGSTLVAAHIQDHIVNWISVGDSRIYLYHNSQLYQLNELHNYGNQLNKQVSRGEISLEEALSKGNKSALTSYIGAGKIALIDQNKKPFRIAPGDRLILMSDGIETITEEEIKQMMCFDVEEAALKMRYLIEAKNKSNQDNFTAIIMEDNYRE